VGGAVPAAHGDAQVPDQRPARVHGRIGEDDRTFTGRRSLEYIDRGSRTPGGTAGE
jgi:hypothetical protein